MVQSKPPPIFGNVGPVSASWVLRPHQFRNIVSSWVSVMSLQSPLSASSTLFHIHTVAHQPNLPCHATSSGVGVRFDGGLLPSLTASHVPVTTERHHAKSGTPCHQRRGGLHLCANGTKGVDDFGLS